MIHTPVYISQGKNDLIFDKSPDLSRLFTSLCWYVNMHLYTQYWFIIIRIYIQICMRCT